VDKFKSLKNKVVLITGTSRGIGRATAEAFLDNESIVVGISRKNKKKNIINNKNYTHFFCDLNDEKKIYQTITLINKNHKKLNVLINNAGVTKEKTNSIVKNVDSFNKTIKINLTAAYIFSMMFVNKTKKNEKGGSIINIASIGGELGFPDNPSYISSKSALIGLTRSFARDYGKSKINCNAVLPGYFKTEMNKKSLTNTKKRIQREDLTMLGRWGEIEELVGTILFLASDTAKYITGQKIIVDGGIVAKGL